MPDAVVTLSLPLLLPPFTYAYAQDAACALSLLITLFAISLFAICAFTDSDTLALLPLFLLIDAAIRYVSSLLFFTAAAYYFIVMVLFQRRRLFRRHFRHAFADAIFRLLLPLLPRFLFSYDIRRYFSMPATP